MKSSSLLFPVELVSAELREQVFEDVYSLKPNRCADKSIEIALLHLHVAKDASHLKQVLLVHDAFQSHWQWMDDGPFQKMVDELLARGYAVWLMDWRAHGSSKKNRQIQLNTIAHMAEFDLTAVCEFIYEKSSSPLTIGARGFGGQMVLNALPHLARVDQLVLLDAQSVLPTRKFWLPGYRLSKWLKLAGRKWLEGNGTEMEVAQLFKAQLKSGGFFGLFANEILREQLTAVAQAAAKMKWLASSKKYERRGLRLLRHSDQVSRTNPQNSAVAFLQAVVDQWR